MSLLKKITDICKAHPNGINVNELAAMCPGFTLDQVVAAARNAHARAKVGRLSASGLGRAARTAPTIYGPPLPDQQPLESVRRNDAAKNEARRLAAKRPRAPVRRRMPVNSVWALAA